MFGSSAVYSSGDFLGLVYSLNAPPHPMSFGEALVKADISGLLLTNSLKRWVRGGFSLECTVDVATLAGFPGLSLFIPSKMWPGAGEMVKYLPCNPEALSLSQEPM